MADITNLFKASIKTVRSRQKQSLVQNDNDINRILPHSKTKSNFTVKSEDLVKSVTKLKQFLLEHRKKYLDVENHLKVDSGAMTDAERDQIDADVQSLMQTCSEAIKCILLEVANEDLSPHIREHCNAVVSLMQAYLKGVCKIYSEQRAVRVKRVVDRKRISRLSAEAPHGKRMNGIIKKSNQIENTSEPNPAHDGEGVIELKGKDSKSNPYPESPSHDSSEDEISPEEAQMFEEENQQLFEEMNSMVDEVRRIEGKVVEISRLQEIFADKVLEQDEKIDNISQLLVGTTENVKAGNEQVREAMKNNAGFRVWILFFLIVCSFSLLFLDWYNN